MRGFRIATLVGSVALSATVFAASAPTPYPTIDGGGAGEGVKGIKSLKSKVRAKDGSGQTGTTRTGIWNHNKSAVFKTSSGGVQVEGKSVTRSGDATNPPPPSESGDNEESN